MYSLRLVSGTLSPGVVFILLPAFNRSWKSLGLCLFCFFNDDFRNLFLAELSVVWRFMYVINWHNWSVSYFMIQIIIFVEYFIFGTE